MSHISIEKKHELGLEEAKTRLADIEPKLKSKYSVTLAWRGEKAEVKGPGVSGEAWLRDDSLGMNLKLGMLLRPMAGKIKSAIENAIDDALA